MTPLLLSSGRLCSTHFMQCSIFVVLIHDAFTERGRLQTFGADICLRTTGNGSQSPMAAAAASVGFVSNDRAMVADRTAISNLWTVIMCSSGQQKKARSNFSRHHSKPTFYSKRFSRDCGKFEHFEHEFIIGDWGGKA